MIDSMRIDGLAIPFSDGAIIFGVSKGIIIRHCQ
jgi:hypothetical protein